MQPLSARNFNTKGSTNKKHSKENVDTYKINQHTNNFLESESKESKNSFTISRSKDYENLLQRQKQNPDSMYTDPKFL